jgi:hypothetical protein
MNRNLNETGDCRPDDLNCKPERDDLNPVVVGRYKAFCPACGHFYDYEVRLFPWCPGCTRTPNGR